MRVKENSPSHPRLFNFEVRWEFRTSTNL